MHSSFCIEDIDVLTDAPDHVPVALQVAFTTAARSWKARGRQSTADRTKLANSGTAAKLSEALEQLRPRPWNEDATTHMHEFTAELSEILDEHCPRTKSVARHDYTSDDVAALAAKRRIMMTQRQGYGMAWKSTLHREHIVDLDMLDLYDTRWSQQQEELKSSLPKVKALIRRDKRAFAARRLLDPDLHSACIWKVCKPFRAGARICRKTLDPLPMLLGADGKVLVGDEMRAERWSIFRVLSWQTKPRPLNSSRLLQKDSGKHWIGWMWCRLKTSPRWRNSRGRSRGQSAAPRLAMMASPASCSG